MVKQADMASGAKTAREKRDEVVVTIDAVCRPHVARPKLLALRWLDASVLVLVAVVVVFVLDAGTDVFAWLGRVLDVAAGRSASAVYAVGAAASVVAGAVLVLPLVRGDRRKAVAELTLPAAVRVAASVLLARPTVLAAIGAGLLTGFAGNSAGVAGLRAGLAGEHVVCDLGRAGVWPWAATAGAASMPASLAAVLVLMGMGSGGLLLAVGLHGSWRLCVRDAKRRVAKRERERRAAEHAKDVLADRGDSPFVDFKDLREWFESDDPIRHPDEDRFDHRFVAHAVARKIDGFSADRFKPASMQVLGPRGSGKSSLMAMVEYYLNHPHAKPMREAAGSAALATEGTPGTGAGEPHAAKRKHVAAKKKQVAAKRNPHAAKSEPDRSPARRATYIVTSVSLWEFTSAEAAMRAILRALVDAIGERAPTADLLSVPSRYAAVVAAPGGLWALAGAVLAGAIEPEDLIARIGRRAVAAGVNVLLWIDDLERFETSETDTLTKLGALLTLMRRTEGLSFVIARSPNAVPATGADGAAKAGFDFEKVVDGTEWVRVEHAPMNAVLMQFRAECERVRRVVEGVPLRDLSARRLLDQEKRAGAEIEQVASPLTHALLDVIETPRELKHVFKRVWHAWDPVDVKNPRDGALCGEIDLDDFIVFTTLRCRSKPITVGSNKVTLTGYWSDLLSNLESMQILAKEMYSSEDIKKPDGTPIAERIAGFVALLTRQYGAAEDAALHQSDAGLRLIHQRKIEAQSAHTHQAIFGSVEVYRRRAIAERAESTPSDAVWKARCQAAVQWDGTPNGANGAAALWAEMMAAEGEEYWRLLDVMGMCGRKAVAMFLEAAMDDMEARGIDPEPKSTAWHGTARRLGALVRAGWTLDDDRQAKLYEIVRRIMAAGGLSVAMLLLNDESLVQHKQTLLESLIPEQRREMAKSFAQAFGSAAGKERLIAHLEKEPHDTLARLFGAEDQNAHPWAVAGAAVLAAARPAGGPVLAQMMRIAASDADLNDGAFSALFACDPRWAWELVASWPRDETVEGITPQRVEWLLERARDKVKTLRTS